MRTNVTTAASTLFNETDRSWDTVLTAFEVINIALVVTTLWVLTCVIAYGTSTRRWRKTPGSSSLSSGAIYVTCAVATALLIPRLVATEILHHVTDIENGLEYCEVICDFAKGSYAVSTFAIYLFLSLRQRLIYKNPYVKERVGKCMNRFSRYFFILLTLVSAAVLCIYVYPNSYAQKPYGCIFKPDGTFHRAQRSVVLGITLTLLQVTILCLSVYPAIRVRFEAHGDLELSLGDDIPSNRMTLKSNFACCDCFLDEGRGFVAVSPVQMSIRRTMLSSLVVVLSDVTAVVIDNVAIPPSAPIALGQTIYDISSLINVFCILGTFGFAVRVLTQFWPSCPKTVAKGANRKRAEAVTEPNNRHQIEKTQI